MRDGRGGGGGLKFLGSGGTPPIAKVGKTPTFHIKLSLIQASWPSEGQVIPVSKVFGH